MKGFTRLVLVMLALAVPGWAAAEALPRPAGLEDTVGFWKRVYTEVSEDQALIHDRRHLHRVYAMVDLPPRDEPERRRNAVRALVAAYEEALERLAEDPSQPASPLQQRLREHFPEDVEPAAFRAAAEGLRVQSGLRERFRAGLERSGRWLPHIRERLRAHGVPEALAAMPHVESSFNPRARSHAGAAGMWQFTAGTGRDYMRIDAVIDERMDPWRSSDAAARLLADNYEKLGSWPLAVTAYNHGANGMRRATREMGTRRIDAIIAGYTGPYFGFASRNFYPAILAAAEVTESPEDYFAGLEMEPALRTVEIEVPDYMPAAAVADALDSDEDSLRRYNSGLSRAVWAGDKFIPAGYALRLPADDPAGLRNALAAVPLDQRYAEQWPDQHHRVRPGESLSVIADRHGVPTLALAAANGITRPDRIQVGQRLRVPMSGEPPKSLAELPVDEGGALYTVRRGDTLAAIAGRFDLGVDELVALNELANPDLIRPGQRLRVRAALEPTRIAGNY
ncbi:LysM peptidoglycan-binding domain-containing protein [Arhodomonas sp. SL1]|uniref:lytic transglycosylase domain-containing protein n=1 Tax=Arhodomonas sp. SL1 TaxID=3425691 RepID=UPI003F88164C